MLWIDEIEKGALRRRAPRTSSDGGITRAGVRHVPHLAAGEDRAGVRGRHREPHRALPPELLRKGRFDEIFFVDLPDAAERAGDPPHPPAPPRPLSGDFDLPGLAARAERFSGAELEQAVVEGLHAAFDTRAQLADIHLARAISETVPLAVTLREEISRIRDWARDRTRPASGAVSQ